MAPSRTPERKLIEVLADLLRERGLEVATEFVLPGTQINADLFLPGAPKGFVIIKTGQALESYISLPEAPANQRALENAGRDAIVFLIVESGSAAIETDLAARLMARTRLVRVDVAQDDPVNVLSPVADRIASEMLERRRDIRNSLQHVFSEDVSGVSANPFSWAGVSPATLFLDPESSNVVREPPNVLYYAPDVASLSPAARRCMEILAIFKDLVPTERYFTLEHEVRQLLEEHTREHYTACALRVGRCLEFVIYSVAVTWGVKVDEVLLKTLAFLERETQRIGSIVLELRDAPKNRKAQVRHQVIEAIVNLQKRLVRFTADFEHEIPDEATTPRRVAAILRDIRKRYGASDVVRSTLDAIEPLAQETLRYRNQAAHADPKGRPREVERESVEQMLETLQRVLFDLSRVGEEIAAIARPTSKPTA
jgi:hypothetical protein